MQINLTREGNIFVLAIDGELSVAKIPVIRAGITKLFKDGKNKMILDLTKAPKVEADTLRELATLNILARELSGEIVLAGMSEGNKSQIELFSKPPVLYCFLTRADAVKHFQSPANSSKSESPSDSQKTGAPAQSAAQAAISAAGTDAMKVIEDLKQEVATLRDSLRQKETGEIDRVRKEAESLKIANQQLEENIKQLIIERKQAWDSTGANEQIRQLETQVAQYLDKIKELDT